MASPRVLAMVLAGGEGKRLMPLTTDRAKPAVPFGGIYRLIDFVLSNLVNASYTRIVVLTQYKSHSLDRHIAMTWRMSTLQDSYVTTVPAQQRRGPRWYAGSADAIYQSLNLIYDDRPDHVVVFGADHVYRMDPRQMVDQHVASGAAVTVAGLRVPRGQASEFGVLDVAANGRNVLRFTEKPTNPPGLPDSPDEIFASMGNYVFSTEALVEAVTTDAADPESAHDLGGSVMPRMAASGDVEVYDFSRNAVPGSTARDAGYWRDVGTLDAYYDAHMDLISVHPVFNLYNREWPILTYNRPLPPAKFVFEAADRVGHALDSMVSAGSIISGGTVRRSVVSPGARIGSNSLVEGSVLLDNVTIGDRAVVRNAILDKSVVVPDGARIGVDPDLDGSRFTISKSGIVVVGKGVKVDP